MADLKHCVECGKVYDFADPPCPHCGATPPLRPRLEAGAPAGMHPPAPTPAIERASTGRPAWLVPVVAVFVIGGAVGLLAALGDDGDEGDQAVLEVDAERVCRDFVKDRLKSPGSAKFSDAAVHSTGGLWAVTGDVDSENGFGALLRTNYTCKVELRGDEWVLVDLITS